MRMQSLGLMLLPFLSIGTFCQQNTTATATTPAPAGNVHRWSADAKNCQTVTMQGTNILIQNDANLQVAAAVRMEDEYARVYLHVLNERSDAVKVDPLVGTFEVVSPKPKTYKALEPDVVARQMQIDMAPIGTGNSTRDYASGMRYGGPATSPEQEDAVKYGLKATMLKTGEQVEGAVFFKPGKKISEVVFRIQVADGMYEFPFTIENNKKK